MKQMIFIALMLVFNIATSAQDGEDKGWANVYRETAPLVNDLVNTKADVKFDYDKSYLYGKVWLTLKPHFYPTDSLRLDAKGMEIKNVTPSEFEQMVQRGEIKDGLTISAFQLLRLRKRV